METFVFLALCFSFPSILGIYAWLYFVFGRKTKCYCRVNLLDKTALITGGSSGIGKATALSLASMGAKVIIASSNVIKGEAAVREIKALTGNTRIVFCRVDLENLSSVKSFAQNIILNEPAVHILINNAAIAYHRKARTKDGCDKLFAINYLGHFLLTYLLSDLLIKSKPCRVVNVSSCCHKFVPKGLDFSLQDDKYGSHLYPHLHGYEVSKLALVLFTKELSRRISGYGVTSNAVHPGFVNSTDIWRKMDLWWSSTMAFILRSLAWPYSQSAESAAQNIVHAAISPQLKGISGKYMERCQFAVEHPVCEDVAMAHRLWDASMLLTGCTLNGKVITELRIENENENKFEDLGTMDFLLGKGKKKATVPDFDKIRRD